MVFVHVAFTCHSFSDEHSSMSGRSETSDKPIVGYSNSFSENSGFIVPSSILQQNLFTTDLAQELIKGTEPLSPLIPVNPFLSKSIFCKTARSILSH